MNTIPNPSTSIGVRGAFRPLALAVATLAAAAIVGLAPEPAHARTGHLALNGGGEVRVVGNLLIYGKLSGRNRIIIVDRRGDAAITINGTRRKGRKVKNSRVRILRTSVKNGRIYVRGRKVTVKVIGPKMDLSAAGTATARLRGTGIYTLNRGSRNTWSTRTGRPRTVKVRAQRAR